MVRSRKWKNSFSFQFQVRWLVEEELVMRPDLPTYPMCLLQYCVMAGFTAFPCSSQQLPGNDGEYISFALPYNGYHITFHLSLRSPLFKFILCPNFFGIPFVFGLTVPQQCIVLVCKSSNNAGDEWKLPMQKLCPTCSFLAASLVTVACVAVIEGVAHFLSLPKYVVILIVYSLESYNLQNFIPNHLCFFGIYCLNMALPLKSTVI